MNALHDPSARQFCSSYPSTLWQEVTPISNGSAIRWWWRNRLKNRMNPEHKREAPALLRFRRCLEAQPTPRPPIGSLDVGSRTADDHSRLDPAGHRSSVRRQGQRHGGWTRPPGTRHVRHLPRAHPTSDPVGPRRARARPRRRLGGSLRPYAPEAAAAVPRVRRAHRRSALGRSPRAALRVLWERLAAEMELAACARCAWRPRRRRASGWLPAAPSGYDRWLTVGLARAWRRWRRSPWRSSRWPARSACCGCGRPRGRWRSRRRVRRGHRAGMGRSGGARLRAGVAPGRVHLRRLSVVRSGGAGGGARRRRPAAGGRGSSTSSTDAPIWRAAGVPGSPYAVALEQRGRGAGEGDLQQPRPARKRACDRALRERGLPIAA